MSSSKRRGEKEAHDFECMGDDTDSHELLAVIATIHHEGVRKTLDDRAVGFTEALNGITTSGVRDVDGRAYLDVVTKRKVESVRDPPRQPFQATVADEGTQAQRMHFLFSSQDLGAGYGTHVNEISRTSTSSYDHLLKSLMVPISSVTSLGRTVYPLGFSTSTSAVSDMLGDCYECRSLACSPSVRLTTIRFSLSRDVRTSAV